MKKISVLLIVFLLTLHMTSVSAETFSGSLPGGKNYLNPGNILIEDQELNTIEAFRVKPGQVYTLSFPNRDMLGDGIYVMIEGETLYVDEYPGDSICFETSSLVVCTFTTTTTEREIQLQIQAEMIGRFYSYYQLENFQLEEGSVVTEYEEYVSPYADSMAPEFMGSGAFITSYDSALLIEDIIASHIVAYDTIDGDVTDQIVLESDAYTGNETTVGDYLVQLAVSDSSGNTTTFDLFILVKDEIAPIISGPNDIYISIEAKNQIDAMLDAFIDYDDEYDDNPILTVTYDEYTPNLFTIGSFPVSIEVKDSSNNVATKDFTIHVEDYDPPVLESATTINVDVSNPMTIDEIMSTVVATDNYDETVDVVLQRDYYTGNESVTGNYFVDILLIDDSNNITERSLRIEVRDTSHPFIEGPEEITTSYTEILSLEEIKDFYSVLDNYDTLEASDILIVSDFYTSNSSNPGVYEIVLALSDEAGNTTEHVLEMFVIDDVSPVIYLDQYIVVIENGSTFGENDMLKLLQLSNEITHMDYQVKVLQNEYKGNEEKAGDYIYKVQLTDSQGEEFVREFKISVKEEVSAMEYTEPIVYTMIGLAIITGVLFYKKYK